MFSRKAKQMIAYGLGCSPLSSRFLGPPKCSVDNPGDETGNIHIQQIEPAPAVPIASPARGFSRELSLHFTKEADLPVPPLYFGRFQNARYYQPTFALIDARDRLLRTFSQGWEPEARYGNYAFEQVRLGRTKKLKGSSLLIDVRTHSQNYFHWLHEAAPRFAIAASQGLAPEKFDHVLVSRPTQSFHKETLKQWNIGPVQVVDTAEHPHVECEELCALSDTWMFPYDAIVRGARASTHSADINVATRRIFIDRRDATTRQLLNANTLYDALQPLGFERVVLSGLSIEAQANLFSAAECIVAVHGAALSNLVFCQPKTFVLELHHPRYLLGLYWRMAQRLGLHYAASVGRDASPDIPDSRAAHLSVDCGEVSQLAKELLISR
jgi:capsular polysaccharide biosynthesis protein